MITLRRHRKDLAFLAFDYVFDRTDKLDAVLPFLFPKLEGEWNVMLVEPKLSDLRVYLDTAVVPSYVKLVVTVEQNQLERLYLERPQLVEKEKTNWELYLEVIQQYPVPLEDKAVRELYYRKGPKLDELREALAELTQYSWITMREINKHFAPVNRVFASQVIKAFLQRRFRQAWRLLSLLEQSLGSTVTFYALRKQSRKAYEEKKKYLQNEESKETYLVQVDGYSVLLMYWLFEEAESPAQLYPILAMFERRIPPC